MVIENQESVYKAIDSAIVVCVSGVEAGWCRVSWDKLKAQEEESILQAIEYSVGIDIAAFEALSSFYETSSLLWNYRHIARDDDQEHVDGWITKYSAVTRHAYAYSQNCVGPDHELGTLSRRYAATAVEAGHGSHCPALARVES